MKAWLSRLRYALPGWVERNFAGPEGATVLRQVARINRQGIGGAVGYFQAGGQSAETVLAANLTLASGLPKGNYLAVKAPALGFDPALLARLAAGGAPLLLDAHGPDQAGPTLQALDALLAQHPGTGIALPARWRRSAGDAERLRASSAPIRLVKGEWADPEWQGNMAAAYLALVDQLAGRKARVAVATHDPALARAALTRLIASGTPCELEQLRGLPRRRTAALARELGVPLRLYLPFGPGWWPYAIDKAFTRPYLPRWWAADLFGQDL